MSAFGDTADSTKQLEVATKAAKAGNAETADSVKMLSAVTKGYGDTSAAAVQKAADLAFQTVKLGQTSFPELAASMGAVVPLASTLKVSQEQLFGAMATLTGVTGSTSEVTTQLKATLQGFMSAVPRDYEESARIDGATNIQLLSRVMVPLAKPGIATITMLSAMGFWNEYPLALVLLTDDAKKTLPIGMANLFEVQKYATDWGALFAGLVIIMIPTMIIYLIGQRYLLQGIGAGGLKG